MPRSVTIASGKANVQLPNGQSYNAGQTVILTDAQWAQVNSALVPSTIIDNGAVGDGGDAVVTQATTVAAPAALTAAAVSTADGTDAASTQALANALKVAHNALLTDVTALRTTLANTLAALKGTGKPMA